MKDQNLLTIEDLRECASFAIKRDGGLTNKQIKMLSEKANKNIDTHYFWDWFVKKYGVPKYNERGWSQGLDKFSFYYFEDYLNDFQK